LHRDAGAASGFAAGSGYTQTVAPAKAGAAVGLFPRRCANRERPPPSRGRRLTSVIATPSSSRRRVFRGTWLWNTISPYRFTAPARSRPSPGWRY